MATWINTLLCNFKPSMEDKQCAAGNEGSNKEHFSPLKKNQYQSKCTLYLEYFHSFASLSDGSFLTGN